MQRLLEAVAGQIRVLRDSGYAIENAVGDMISEGRVEIGSTYAALQRLDHLVQSLDGISSYLEHLMEEVDPSLSVDPSAAVRRIKQRDLALALVGNQFVPSEPEAIKGAGEATFF